MNKKLGKTTIKNAMFIFYSLNNLNYERIRKSYVIFLTPANYERTIPWPKCIEIS